MTGSKPVALPLGDIPVLVSAAKAQARLHILANLISNVNLNLSSNQYDDVLTSLDTWSILAHGPCRLGLKIA